jgi:phosphotransferase system  glucose/maltose/N-acetylglucosamine-specific IIC component
MMIMELNSYRLSFYAPYSLLLAMVHSAFSGLTCLTFLQLDPNKKKLELFTIISIAIMFCGMLGNIIGLRIYFSIMINSVAFSVMYFSVRWLIKREDIEVDCHGDKARVAEFTSKIVDD